MGYVFLWLFIALFAALVANNKGRSGFLWFVFGLFIGPFAVLLAFFSKEDETKEDKIAASNSAKSMDDFFKDNKSYYYQINMNDVEGWNTIRKDIFEHLEDGYKLKRNDGDEMLFEINKEVYIKASQKVIDHKMFYLVYSIGCGKIEFSDSLEVVGSKEINHDETPKEKTTPSTDTNELVKLSELLEKGHLTKEEFDAQKKKILGM